MLHSFRVVRIAIPKSRAAQPGIAADRFAREIVAILKARCGALAAAECQPVRPLSLTAVSSRIWRVLALHIAFWSHQEDYYL